MEKVNAQMLDPNFVPDDLKIPYDIIELPSQGLLYNDKIKNVKVEYLTALDESILTSPNIASSGKMLDLLLERKIKDLPIDPLDLLSGDRTAIIVFLRTTAFGVDYTQVVYDDKNDSYEDGVINLAELKQKKLEIKSNSDGEFEYVLPKSGKKITFSLLTGRDEKIIEERDGILGKRNNDGVSHKIILSLEQHINSIDGERDKIKISNIIKRLSIFDSRSLRKYINEITPGLDFNTNARTPGGVSVACFLRFNTSFFWPEI